MRRLLAVFAAAVAWLPPAAYAQTLLDETNTIVAPTAPSAVQREFQIASAGVYELAVTDFGVPAALSGVRAAVVRDGVIVRKLELGSAANASVTFDATPGAHTLSIVGTPGAAGVGTVAARVRRGTDAPVLEVTDTIQMPNPPPPATRRILDATFTIADPGAYTVSLGDLGFPVALHDVQLSLVREGGTAPTLLARPGSATFNALPGNYRLFVIANADATTEAGVFAVDVRATAAAAPVYRRTVTAGRIEQLGGGVLTAGAHTLVGSDLALPAPLASLALAVTSGGLLAARLDASGSVDFSAPAGEYELLCVARPAAATSGSFAAELRRAGTPVASFVSTASDGASAGAVTLTGTVASAGMHRLRLTDFAFPQGFTALRATVTQAGASVATLAAPGTTDINLQAGAVTLLVFGVANTSANGIYGVELRPASATGTTVIEATRGVGTAFDAWQFSVTTAGRYRVIADDLEFPERFAGLDAVITRGPEVVGSLFGGGAFNFSATPGSYFITFIAKPGANSGGSGTYRMRVAIAPSLPAVTLRANPTQVSPGGTTRLEWNASDATACTASGAWSGNKAASGSETTAALSTQSTFNLECTGPGGTSATQLVVSVSAPTMDSGGGGGGGALSETLLLGLLAAAALRLSARARASLPR